MTQLPFAGPDKVDCPDGCGLFGKPVKSRSGHVRGCPCRPCIGGRSSKSGKARHRKFAKNAGIRVGHRSTSEEEAWRDTFRWEIKTGKQVDPIVTKYELAWQQSETARPIGDPRPFAFGVSPTESARPSLVVVDAKVWRALIVPLLNESSWARAKNAAKTPELVGSCSVCGRRVVLLSEPWRWVDPETGADCEHQVPAIVPEASMTGGPISEREQT